MRSAKAKLGVDFAFLAVVNIVDMHSSLLLCSQAEHDLAAIAFEGCPMVREKPSKAEKQA